MDNEEVKLYEGILKLKASRKFGGPLTWKMAKLRRLRICIVTCLVPVSINLALSCLLAKGYSEQLLNEVLGYDFETTKKTLAYRCIHACQMEFLKMVHATLLQDIGDIVASVNPSTDKRRFE